MIIDSKNLERVFDSEYIEKAEKEFGHGDILRNYFKINDTVLYLYPLDKILTDNQDIKFVEITIHSAQRATVQDCATGEVLVRC